MEKSCGTCRWAESLSKDNEHKVEAGKPRVDCVWNLHHKTPDSINIYISFMYAEQGTTCPCWESKQ
jgi:hypothetical protein